MIRNVCMLHLILGTFHARAHTKLAHHTGSLGEYNDKKERTTKEMIEGVVIKLLFSGVYNSSFTVIWWHINYFLELWTIKAWILVPI